MTVPAVNPSGSQFELVHGRQRAVVVEVGAGLRDYRVAGRPVVDGYGEQEMCDAGRGQVLIPWPNRIEDGRYSFAGQPQQLPLTEPARHNAIHGLVRWATWEVAERSAARVVLRHRLYPRPGYPFVLDCEVEYGLDADGLRVRTTTTNSGPSPCPCGSGAHPYLTAGTPDVDDAVLTAPGNRYLPSDERGIPTGVAEVAGTSLDFRAGRPLRGVQLDSAFTDLDRDADGLAWVELRAADGAGRVRLWQDGGYPYLQLFTGDTLPPDRRRGGLAVEPLTCPPNAFRTGAGLRVLQPGEAATAVWGIVAD